MREQCRTAQRLAEWLAGDRRVRARLLSRACRSIPATTLAARQMDGAFGAMLSFEVAGDFAAAKRVVESTRLFQLAVSLGAVESLIEQPASMSHASYDREDRLAHGITDGLIRASRPRSLRRPARRPRQGPALRGIAPACAPCLEIRFRKTMPRKLFFVSAAVLAFAAVEVAGSMLWPTQCSRCTPLRVSPAYSVFHPSQLPGTKGRDDAGERVKCPKLAVRFAHDR